MHRSALLERGGGTRHYTSGSSGRLSANYFQIISGDGVTKLIGDVSTAALNGLANAIGRDAAAYARIVEPGRDGSARQGGGAGSDESGYR